MVEISYCEENEESKDFLNFFTALQGIMLDY